METMKRFIEVIIHHSTCNLKCHYCYLSQQGVDTSEKPCWNYSPEYIAKCLTPERLGGYCCFNVCTDGETMLSKETMEVIRLLASQGHYVNIVTNGTISKMFDEVITWEKDVLERLMFLFSYHFLELERLNLLEKFFENVRKVRNAGCSYNVTAVLCDEYFDRIDDLKSICIKEINVSPHFSPYRKRNLDFCTRFDDKEYIANGKQQNSLLFDAHVDWYHKKVTEFCYAGDWFSYLDLLTGDIMACYRQPVFYNIYDKPEEKIPFEAIGNHCKVDYCYNSPSRIVAGIVPEIKVDYSYAEAQNLIEMDGTDTTNAARKEFCSPKLYETNNPYSEVKKRAINKHYEEKYMLNDLPRIHPRRIKRKLKSISKAFFSGNIK